MGTALHGGASTVDLFNGFTLADKADIDREGEGIYGVAVVLCHERGSQSELKLSKTRFQFITDVTIKISFPGWTLIGIVTMNMITRILDEMSGGKRQAADELFPLVYDELRRIAAAQLAHERIGQTLQPTALVHEVFLRLVVPERQQDWTSVGHFMAVAAHVMRHILIDTARRKKQIKQGGEFQRVNVELEGISGHIDDQQLIELDNALNELEKQDPVKAKLIVLRYFGGMTIEQACEVLGISRTTAHRHWTYARAWLFQRVGRIENKDSETDTPVPSP